MFFSDEELNIQIQSVHLAENEQGHFYIAGRDICALGFRVEGDAEFTVKGEKFVSRAGDIIYMPHRTDYSVNYSGGKILAIHFTCDNISLSPENYRFSDNENLYKLFLKALNAWENKALGNKHFVKSVFYDILSRLFQQVSKKEIPPHFNKAVEIININFKNPELNIPEICRVAGLGQTAFRALFKTYYATTPVDYINGLRLENAKSLIYNGFTVGEAAIKSGFNDPKYFSRLVKQKYGCTPRELKNFVI